VPALFLLKTDTEIKCFSPQRSLTRPPRLSEQARDGGLGAQRKAFTTGLHGKSRIFIREEHEGHEEKNT